MSSNDVSYYYYYLKNKDNQKLFEVNLLIFESARKWLVYSNDIIHWNTLKTDITST